MTFSLLREAVAASKLADKMESALTIKQALGAKTLTQVLEVMSNDSAYTLSREDYARYLEVINDLAQQDGVTISTKRSLAEYAFRVLDDDPAIDAIGGDREATKQRIINTLWAAYQAAKAHAGLQRHVQRSSNEENEEFHNLDTGVVDVSDATDEQSSDEDSPREGESYEDFMARTGQHEDEDDASSDDSDIPTDGSDLPDDVSISVTKTDGDGNDDNDDDFDLTAMLHAIIGDDDQFGIKDKLAKDDKSEDKDTDPKKVNFDDEEQAKTFFRQAITSPKEMLAQATKEIEDEAAKAFRDLELPKNPHPKGSPAHKAWLKGMKNEVKKAFGIVDKPASAAGKPRRR